MSDLTYRDRPHRDRPRRDRICRGGRGYLGAVLAGSLMALVSTGSFAAEGPAPERTVAPSADADTRADLVRRWQALGSDYRPRTEHLFEDGSPRYINRLVAEASPYLLQHAHNPVDWFPWGEEAFARARELERPVFLSIGYATCHWCHVMERESFENEDIAAYMNEHFVSIKVDREQLPDVDALFMSAVQMISGSGGWPMSSFLDTDAQAFHGGTYFPPVQFLDLLERVSLAWQEQRPQLLEEAERIAAAIASLNRVAGEAREVGAAELLAARAQLLARFDRDGGGFGHAPKFPQESSLRFLLDQARRSGDPTTLATVLQTLHAMADGGIHDQIAGGFHRYSVDRFWQVPHFEKMLYNQAGLARVYAEAAWLSGDADLTETARGILDYVLRDMRDADGLFYSATDADSEGREGAFFTWTPASLRTALDDGNDEDDGGGVGVDGGDAAGERAAADVELAGLLWDIDGFGNFEGESIPNRAERLEDIARRRDVPVEALRTERAALAERLRIARERREKPLRDEKILTGWNGMMIAALADASVLLDEPRYLSAARRAAEALWATAHGAHGAHGADGADDGLMRVRFGGRTEVPARQTDYAWLADGLIALHDADVSERRSLWLGRAALLLDEMDERFADPLGGGFFLGGAEVGGTSLAVRPKDLHDASTPSGTGVALQAITRLAVRTGEQRHRERADELVVGLSPLLAARGGGTAAILTGLAEHLGGETGPVRTAARGKVRVEVRRDAQAPERVRIVAELSEGWHLNSAQPLQDYLIPMRLTDGEGEALTDPVFPEPLVRTLAFQRQALSLYEGRVVMSAELPEGDGDGTGVGTTVPVLIEMQACDERVCLAPETLRFEVPGVVPPAPSGSPTR